MLEGLKALIPNISDRVKRLAMVLVAVFVLCSIFPRNSQTRQAWGFPFVYKYEVKPAYITDGEEDKRREFNLIMLFWDVWLTSAGTIFIWFILGNVWFKTRRSLDDAS